MSNKHSKNWGSTVEIIKNAFVEVHRAEINKGGHCSEHLHQYKTNTFIVESGKLLIKQFRPTGTVDETILYAGDYIECPPNEKHQFVGLEDTVLYEVYYPQGIGAVDIVRFSEGFMAHE